MWLQILYIQPTLPPRCISCHATLCRADTSLACFAQKFITHRPHSCKVPRLIEHMIPMPSDTLTLKQRREAHVLRHLLLANAIISTLRLADDELADLSRPLVSTTQDSHHASQWMEGVRLTCNSVSVIVPLDTLAYPLRFNPLYKIYSHHRSQSLGSISCIPLLSPTHVP